MMYPPAKTGARINQLPGIVAVRATDNHDDVALSRQLNGRILALLCRLADSIHKAHFRFRKALANHLDQLANTLNGLRRLGNHPESPLRLEPGHVLFREHDIEII